MTRCLSEMELRSRWLWVRESSTPSAPRRPEKWRTPSMTGTCPPSCCSPMVSVEWGVCQGVGGQGEMVLEFKSTLLPSASAAQYSPIVCLGKTRHSQASTATCLLADGFASLSGFTETLRHCLPTDTQTRRDNIRMMVGWGGRERQMYRRHLWGGGGVQWSYINCRAAPSTLMWRLRIWGCKRRVRRSPLSEAVTCVGSWKPESGRGLTYGSRPPPPPPYVFVGHNSCGRFQVSETGACPPGT